MIVLRLFSLQNWNMCFKASDRCVLSVKTISENQALRIRVRNFQSIVFIWAQGYSEIFKSAFNVPLITRFISNSYFDKKFYERMKEY